MTTMAIWIQHYAAQESILLASISIQASSFTHSVNCLLHYIN